MQFTSEMNDGKTVFVFGSNLAGIHGAGAAMTARKHWGAAMRVGVGRTGMAYAIPTKDFDIRTMPVAAIEPHVHDFLDYAQSRPELQFLVTAVGTGLAGLKHEQIAPMFKSAPINCVLPEEWKTILAT